MKFMTDTVYIHYSSKLKIFYVPEPELLVEFAEPHTLVDALLKSLNRIRSIRRFNYSPMIYICFTACLLCTILVYYYKWLTIAALALFALTFLFLILKFCKGRAVDKELGEVVFEHLEKLRVVFDVKIKSAEFFVEFKRVPAIVLKPRNPFTDLFAIGDVKFIADEKSHLSFSLSMQQKQLASKRLGYFLNQAKERGMLISSRQKAELYKFTQAKKDSEAEKQIGTKDSSPQALEDELNHTQYAIDHLERIIHQNGTN